MFLGDSLISWKTKKQKTVSKSSAEAELRSMSKSASEVTWVDGIYEDLNFSIPKPITLYCDNKAANYIAHNPVYRERTKHLKLDCYYIRDCIEEGLLSTAYIKSSLQFADIFTKPLGESQHHFLSSKLGLVPTSPT